MIRVDSGFAPGEALGPFVLALRLGGCDGCQPFDLAPSPTGAGVIANHN